MKYDYDSVRELFPGAYDNVAWADGCGTGRSELNKEIRRIYNAGQAANEPFILTRAKMLKCELDHVRCAVSSFDPLADNLERLYLCGRNSCEIQIILYERHSTVGEFTLPGREMLPWVIGSAQADVSHTTPNWEDVLQLGFSGLLRRAEEAYAADPCPFTEAVKIVYTAVRDFLFRYAAVARRGERSDIAETLEFLADAPPQTLLQALQLSLLYRVFQESEGEWVRSMGIFDRLYRPFYEKDIADGTLTPAEAEELLTIYFARFSAQSRGIDAGTPFCFGGYLPGAELKNDCNEITRIAWRAVRRINEVDPKFCLRVNPDTPEDILMQIAGCIKSGNSATVFANETIAREMFLKSGKDPEDLCNFVPIGCYEPAIMGKELSCTMSGIFNFAAIGERLWDDENFIPENYEEVENLYLQKLDAILTELMQMIGLREKSWYDINPAPLLSGTMRECMADRLDVTQGGTKYATSGIMCAGIGTAADTLAAIRYLVFEKKRLTFAELGKVLAADWQEHEMLRLEAKNHAPKWGCGDDTVDTIARKLTDAAAKRINSTPNVKGGHYQMGLWSIDYSQKYGEKMGATADGRKAGDFISKNTGSSVGCDKEGIAGLLDSVTKLDHTQFSDGAVLDVMLPSASVAGEEGTQFICRIVRNFFERGGFYIHLNILSPEVLKEAQRHPEKYRNLQIRLCGWNARFVDLNKPMQDNLICEAESREA